MSGELRRIHHDGNDSSVVGRPFEPGDGQGVADRGLVFHVQNLRLRNDRNRIGRGFENLRHPVQIVRVRRDREIVLLAVHEGTVGDVILLNREIIAESRVLAELERHGDDGVHRFDVRVIPDLGDLVRHVDRGDSRPRSARGSRLPDIVAFEHVSLLIVPDGRVVPGQAGAVVYLRHRNDRSGRRRGKIEVLVIRVLRDLVVEFHPADGAHVALARSNDQTDHHVLRLAGREGERTRRETHAHVLGRRDRAHEPARARNRIAVERELRRRRFPSSDPAMGLPPRSNRSSANKPPARPLHPEATDRTSRGSALRRSSRNRPSCPAFSCRASGRLREARPSSPAEATSGPCSTSQPMAGTRGRTSRPRLLRCRRRRSRATGRSR